jgi:hypothetical protein
MNMLVGLTIKSPMLFFLYLLPSMAGWHLVNLAPSIRGSEMVPHEFDSLGFYVCLSGLGALVKDRAQSLLLVLTSCYSL